MKFGTKVTVNIKVWYVDTYPKQFKGTYVGAKGGLARVKLSEDAEDGLGLCFNKKGDVILVKYSDVRPLRPLNKEAVKEIMKRTLDSKDWGQEATANPYTYTIDSLNKAVLTLRDEVKGLDDLIYSLQRRKWAWEAENGR
jgi:hypothetical protein